MPLRKTSRFKLRLGMCIAAVSGDVAGSKLLTTIL